MTSAWTSGWMPQSGQQRAQCRGANPGVDSSRQWNLLLSYSIDLRLNNISIKHSQFYQGQKHFSFRELQPRDGKKESPTSVRLCHILTKRGKRSHKWLCSNKQNCIADGLRLIWAQWLALNVPARKDLAGAPMFQRAFSDKYAQKKSTSCPRLRIGALLHRDQWSDVSGTSCLKSTNHPRGQHHKNQQSIFRQGVNYSATLLKWHIENIEICVVGTDSWDFCC